MKLILHIGITKTGTSAIQSFLWKYRKILIEKYNSIYPETGIFFGAGPAHYEFTWFYFSDLKGRLRRNPQAFEQFKKTYNQPKEIYDKLFTEINKYTFLNYIILSSENFSVLRPDLLHPEINSFLNKANVSKIIIIAYFRRQDRWIEAQYSQHVKGGGNRELGFLISNFLRNRSELYYDRFLKNWKKTFPEASIIPRIYDRKLFPHGNVIIDFLNILDINDINMLEAKANIIEANPSLGAISTLVLRKLNENFNLPSELHKKVVQYLIKLDREEEIPIKTFLTLSERLKIIEHFKKSNENFFREWFGVDNYFVLSEEEIKFYEEQDKIPEDIKEKIIEERYRKVLTFLMEENGKSMFFFKFSKKPEIIYNVVDEVEHMQVDTLQLDLLKNTLTIGGLVLLKKEAPGDFKLIAKYGDEEVVAQWGLPSPSLAKRFPHNPKAESSRFIIKGLFFNKKCVEIFLEKTKLIEIRFDN